MLGSDPFLASLRRHRLVAGLIVLQAALTTILLALALAKASEIRSRVAQPSGLEEARLLRVLVHGPARPGTWAREQEALAQLPGVAGVTRINQLPFGTDAWRSSFGRQPDAAGGTTRVAIYLGAAGLRQQLGVALLAGRDFHDSEYVDDRLGGFAQVLIGQSLARRLFPDRSALGGTVFFGPHPLQVVGVYGALQGAAPEDDETLILPVRWRAQPGGAYLLRLAGTDRPAPERVAAALHAQSPGRWLADLRSVAELREAYFLRERWLGAGLLAGMALWLVGTGLGLANLADLLLQARQRQIWLCRALGARSAQIRWQLRRENLLLSLTGALAGLALLHLVLRVWPWLGMQLQAGSPPLQLAALALMVLTGQCAMWPITREADAVSPAGRLRPA